MTVLFEAGKESIQPQHQRFPGSSSSPSPVDIRLLTRVCHECHSFNTAKTGWWSMVFSPLLGWDWFEQISEGTYYPVDIVNDSLNFKLCVRRFAPHRFIKSSPCIHDNYHLLLLPWSHYYHRIVAPATTTVFIYPKQPILNGCLVKQPFPK